MQLFEKLGVKNEDESQRSQFYEIVNLLQPIIAKRDERLRLDSADTGFLSLVSFLPIVVLPGSISHKIAIAHSHLLPIAILAPETQLL